MLKILQALTLSGFSLAIMMVFTPCQGVEKSCEEQQVECLEGEKRALNLAKCVAFINKSARDACYEVESLHGKTKGCEAGYEKCKGSKK